MAGREKKTKKSERIGREEEREREREREERREKREEKKMRSTGEIKERKEHLTHSC